MNTLELNNGLRIDQLGFGTADIGDDEITKNAVQSAIDVGYRRIDTASYYDNEHVIGEVISNSDLPREEFTIATKVWNSDQGYDGTLNSIQTSMRKLKTDYIDIFLLHWPVPNKRLKSWKAMEELYESGTLKAIGVSNFTIDHLEELIQHSPVPPVINQVEFHPFLFQSELLKYCNSKDIILEAYSPLVVGKKFNHPLLQKLSETYNKTPAQILLRWGIQLEISVIPKASSFSRIQENFYIFDFNIESEDMTDLSSLHEDLRTNWDPTGVK